MPITDAFTGTNGTGITAYSANWAYTNGSGTNFQIQSNGVSANNLSLDFAAERTETGFPAAHYAQTVLPAIAASSSLGASVRCQGSATAQYYGFYSSTTGSELFANDGVTWTQLGAEGAAFSAGDTLRLTVSGTTLTPNKNGSTTGTPGAQSDGTFSNGKPGICGWNGSASLGTRLDDFECTDISAGVFFLGQACL